MRPLTALMCTVSGCLAVVHALVTSKLLWLGIGFPVVAIGLSLTGSPINAMRAASRWLAERALDLEALCETARCAPEWFRQIRAEIKETR